MSLVFFLYRHRRLPTNPSRLFNDYLFWKKNSDVMTETHVTNTSDKALVKEFITAKLGTEHAIPTLALLENPDDMISFQFPERCVIKPTHSSSQIIIRKNGEEIDLGEIRSWFDFNFYKIGRERNYRDLRKRVIVEPIVFDNDDIEDIKIFCYNGAPKAIQWDFDRHTKHTRKLYNLNWDELGYTLGYPLSKKTTEKPALLDGMVHAARILSASFDLVRIDFFTNNEQYYVGEITHLHGNCGERFFPNRKDERLFSQILFDL